MLVISVCNFGPERAVFLMASTQRQPFGSGLAKKNTHLRKDLLWAAQTLEWVGRGQRGIGRGCPHLDNFGDEKKPNFTLGGRGARAWELYQRG